MRRMARTVPRGQFSARSMASNRSSAPQTAFSSRTGPAEAHHAQLGASVLGGSMRARAARSAASWRRVPSTFGAGRGQLVPTWTLPDLKEGLRIAVRRCDLEHH